MAALTTAESLSRPTPPASDVARWHETARRGRLLNGAWAVDLRDALRKEFEPRRRRALGMPDTTRNLFRAVVNQLAVLYDVPPTVTNDTGAAADLAAMKGITATAGLWQIAVTLNQLTIGQRECFYRFDVPRPPQGEKPKLLVRVVPADLVVAFASPDCPDVPHTVHEYRLRSISLNGRDAPKQTWTRDVLSVEDPAAPVFRVETASGSADLSAQVLPTGGLSGDAYPYRMSTGVPILPFVMYHARITGKLWDSRCGIELVDGSLTVAGLWTQWRHVVRDASWPQRWALNVKVAGLVVDPESGDAGVTADPSSLINFVQDRPGTPSSIGQFEPGGDPRNLGNAIRDYAADLVGDFDLQPADVARTHSDARSGYAIEITRDGQRQAIRRQAPSFKRGDEQALGTIAALWNRATGSALPETGWGVDYRGIPLSLEERRLIMEDHAQRAELGITSKVKLLAAVEGITEDEARVELLKIQQDNAIFDMQPATAPASAETDPTPEADDG